MINGVVEFRPFFPTMSLVTIDTMLNLDGRADERGTLTKF